MCRKHCTNGEDNEDLNHIKITNGFAHIIIKTPKHNFITMCYVLHPSTHNVLTIERKILCMR